MKQWLNQQDLKLIDHLAVALPSLLLFFFTRVLTSCAISSADLTTLTIPLLLLVCTESLISCRTTITGEVFATVMAAFCSTTDDTTPSEY